MRKKEDNKKEAINSKLEVHFLENVEEGAAKREPPQENPQDSATKRAAGGIPAGTDADRKDRSTQSEKKKREAEETAAMPGPRWRDTEPLAQVTGEMEPERKTHRLSRVLFTLLLLVIVAIAVVAVPIGREYFRKTASGDDIEVTIEAGSSSRQVGEILKEKGVIRNENAFLLKLYFSDYWGKLRYGTFDLNDGMSLAEVIETLATADGQKKENVLTIPEGYTIEMTAAKLEKENIMKADEFLAAVERAADSATYKAQLPDKSEVYYQLQGYIYPDTYYLSDDMTGDELVAMILAQFDEKFDSERQKAAEALGMTVEEVLIRASLVQKETEKPEEYATIAGVIQNRLDKDMKLQFDSTAVYAITKGQYGMDRVLYSDLKVDSPYNTYKNKGLPPGPICSPSLEAIDGVLHAEKHDYLYFQMDMTKNDGSNIFSKTYEEHQAASATTGEKKETETTSTATSATEEKKTDNTKK